MWKKILVGLVALGFAWSIPDVRVRVATWLAPAIGLLGPVGYRMQEPLRKYKAETDIKFLVDQLHLDREEGRQLPRDTRTFTEWMLRRKGAGDKGRDPWGNLYWMERGAPGSTRIGSNGPDGTKKTTDDLFRIANM